MRRVKTTKRNESNLLGNNDDATRTSIIKSAPIISNE